MSARDIDVMLTAWASTMGQRCGIFTSTYARHHGLVAENGEPTAWYLRLARAEIAQLVDSGLVCQASPPRYQSSVCRGQPSPVFALTAAGRERLAAAERADQ